MVSFRQTVQPLVVVCAALVSMAVFLLTFTRPPVLKEQRVQEPFWPSPTAQSSSGIPQASPSASSFCPALTTRPTWETLPFDCPAAGRPQIGPSGLITLSSGSCVQLFLVYLQHALPLVFHLCIGIRLQTNANFKVRVDVSNFQVSRSIRKLSLSCSFGRLGECLWGNAYGTLFQYSHLHKKSNT